MRFVPRVAAAKRVFSWREAPLTGALYVALQHSYIVPGLGDVGDRLWGTTKESTPAGDASTPTTGAGNGAGAGAKATKRRRK